MSLLAEKRKRRHGDGPLPWRIRNEWGKCGECWDDSVVEWFILFVLILFQFPVFDLLLSRLPNKFFRISPGSFHFSDDVVHSSSVESIHLVFRVSLLHYSTSHEYQMFCSFHIWNLLHEIPPTASASRGTETQCRSRNGPCLLTSHSDQPIRNFSARLRQQSSIHTSFTARWKLCRFANFWLEWRNNWIGRW